MEEINDIGGITDSLENLASRPKVLPEPRRQDAGKEMAKLEQKARRNVYDANGIERDPLAIQLTEEEDRERLGFLAAMADKEFYTHDLGGRANRAARNWAANILGAPSDMVSMLLMLRAADPVNGPMLMNALGVNNIWDIPGNIPGNSEAWAKTLGGDPEEASMLATAFLSPADLAAAAGARAPAVLSVFGGGIAAERKGGPLYQRMKDFLKREADTVGEGKSKYDDQLFKETGWFRDEAGDVKFHLSDAGSKIRQNVFNRELSRAVEQAKKDGMALKTKFSFTLEDILDHEDLYELYPELAGLRLDIPVIVDPKGTYSFATLDPKDTFAGRLKTEVSGGGFGTPALNRMETGNIDGDFGGSVGLDAFRKVLLHETEHAVQTLEGFATGTAKIKVDKLNTMLDRWQNVRATEDVFDAIDKGNVAPDDIIDYMVKKGHTAQDAARIYQDSAKEAKQYAEAILDNDNLQALSLRTEYEGVLAQDERELAHVLNYLLIDEDTTPDMINTIMERLRFEDMDKLSYAAYRNSLGEAYARLNERLADAWTLEKAPNPNDLRATDATLSPNIPLSVGNKLPPGYVVPKELTEFKLADVLLDNASDEDSLRALIRGADVYLSPTDRELLQSVVDKDPGIMVRWLKALEETPVIKEAKSEGPPMDPMANWHNTQSSGRGGANQSIALDVPNEGSLVSTRPEGTHRVVRGPSGREIKVTDPRGTAGGEFTGGLTGMDLAQHRNAFKQTLKEVQENTDPIFMEQLHAWGKRLGMDEEEVQLIADGVIKVEDSPAFWNQKQIKQALDEAE